MERLSQAAPAAAKKVEVHKPVARSKGPKESPPVKDDKGEKVQGGQQAAHDFDLALAALHAGDYDSAAALVEKLRRAGQNDPTNYQLAIVQLGLLVREGKDCAQRHKVSSALRAFAKQANPGQSGLASSVDRSV